MIKKVTLSLLVILTLSPILIVADQPDPNLTLSQMSSLTTTPNQEINSTPTPTPAALPQICSTLIFQEPQQCTVTTQCNVPIPFQICTDKFTNTQNLKCEQQPFAIYFPAAGNNQDTQTVLIQICLPETLIYKTIDVFNNNNNGEINNNNNRVLIFDSNESALSAKNTPVISPVAPVIAPVIASAPISTPQTCQSDFSLFQLLPCPTIADPNAQCSDNQFFQFCSNTVIPSPTLVCKTQTFTVVLPNTFTPDSKTFQAQVCVPATTKIVKKFLIFNNNNDQHEKLPVKKVSNKFEENTHEKF